MLNFILRRLLAFPFVFFAVYAVAVLLVIATPGEGLESGEKDLPPEVLEARRRTFNYDQSWLARYFWTWPRRLVWERDLPSLQYPDWTVAEILGNALPVSIQLGFLALGFALLFGTFVGSLAAVFHGRWIDHLTVSIALVGVSLPTFVVGATLLLCLGLWLGAVPAGGWGTPAQALLPAITLGLPYAAYVARLSRSSMIEALAGDYVRTARAKGLSEFRVVVDHALPNALLPVLSYLGPAAAAIFTGSFVVEKIFAIPGVGTHVVESIHNRDQTVILATVMLYAGLLTTFNLVVDVLYGLVDPRIRLGAAR